MNRKSSHLLLDSIRLLIILVIPVAVAQPMAAQASADDSWQPGREYCINDPAAGTDGYFLVYVPADYDPGEKWPVVFYYHGLGGRPDTSTIRRIANDRYCIVAGMSYYAPGMEGYRFMDTEDVRIFHHVLASIKKQLNVDEKKFYVGGFSKGGFYTCDMLRLLSDELAGAIIFGAGSKSINSDWPSFVGKEVFIGCGQKDQFITMAREASKRLETLGATVTLEEWPETGHSVGDIAGIRKWIFEQTVDRPSADPVTNKVDGSSETSSLPAETENDPKTKNIPRVAIAGILAISTMIGIVLVIWRRRSHSHLPAKDESKEGSR